MTNLSKVLRMASVMKAGDMLKQTVSKHTSSVPEKTKHLSSAPIPNMNILLRQIKSPAFKLFVGGLSYDVDDSKLKEAFSQYGEIVEAQVVMDAATSRSRGFGFVSFKSSEQANIAIQNLDGQFFYGRRLGVNFTSDLIGLRSGGAAASASSGGGGYRSGANGGGGRRF